MKQSNKNKLYMKKIRKLNKFCFSHDSNCDGCRFSKIIDSKGCCLLENQVQKLDDKIVLKVQKAVKHEKNNIAR